MGKWRGRPGGCTLIGVQGCYVLTDDALIEGVAGLDLDGPFDLGRIAHVGALDVAPGELMLVAAHPSDLRAARDAGLTTAYVMRPLERGEGRRLPRYEEGEFDFVASDFVDLARLLVD